jgi:Arc/MetJ-type ribon-helix-helix transcriptional regulator
MNDTQEKEWKRISIIFNKEILAMVERFIKEKGYDTTSEVVKQAVRALYTKEFPAYVEARQSVPKSIEDKIDYEDRKKMVKEKKEEDRCVEICKALGGTIELNDGGNKVCKYFTYDKKNRYEQELPLLFLTEDLIASQYSPSREDVERRQAEGKVNY